MATPSTLGVDILSTTDGSVSVEVSSLVGASSNFTPTQLRAYAGAATRVFVYHSTLTENNPGSWFYRNDSVLSPVDNTGLRIVDAAGRAWDRQFEGPAMVSWFGAVGDGVTDDSAAFNLAVSACQDNVPMGFPSGDYVLNTPSTMSGYTHIVGTGTARIIGNLTYNEPAFPASADSPGTVAYDSPRCIIENIIFDSDSTTNFCLNIVAQYGTSFIDVGEVRNCKFYGYNGLLLRNCISVHVEGCWFYGVYEGMRTEGCANINVIGSWFRNQRKIALNITYNSLATGRKGGENVRVQSCEFAVCARGLYAFRHQWLVINNCLFDYNILPVELHGSYYASIESSYLGASLQGSLTGGVGYEAPPTTGMALYVHAADTDALGSASYGGVVCFDTKFVDYLSGSVNPNVWVNGYLASQGTGKIVERVTFNGCQFITTQTHSKTRLLAIDYCEESAVTNCNFVSPDLSSTLISPYTADNVGVHHGAGNCGQKCTQSGVIVPSTYDYQTSAGLTAVTGTGVWFRDAGGVQKLGLNSSGVPTIKNVTEYTSAGTGGAPAPETVAGFIIVNINGTDRKIAHHPV